MSLIPGCLVGPSFVLRYLNAAPSDTLWSYYLEAQTRSMYGIIYTQYFGEKITYRYAEGKIEKNMLLLRKRCETCGTKMLVAIQ